MGEIFEKPTPKFKVGDKIIAYNLPGVIIGTYFNNTPGSPGRGKWWYDIDFDNGYGGCCSEEDAQIPPILIN